MTNFKLLFLMSIIVSVIIVGCEEKEDTTPTPTTYTNKMTAKVNGVDYVATTITGKAITGAIYLRAEKGNNTIALNLDFFQATGTFTMSSNMYPIGFYTADGEDVYCDTGTVIISTHDEENNVIKGTFNFTTKPSGNTTIYKITEGAFDIKYTTPY